MKHIYWIIGLLSLLTNSLQAQTPACNCAVTITQSGIYSNATLNVQPGQTVCIQAGHYDNLRFTGFVGTAAQPIRFVNCGGQVGLGTESNSNAGIAFLDSRYFVLSGSGSSTIPYGFLVDKSKSGASAVSVGGFSSDYEVERVEVATSGYAGFFMKLDPGCDPMTYQPNFAIYNVKIHDNYIHNVSGPGMFLGSGYSAITGTTITCNGVPKLVYPVQTYGMEVYNNRVERTSGAALNINNAPGASVHDNTLLYNNLGPVPAGWQVGGSSACGCDYTITKAGTYNNWLLQVPPGKKVCVQAGLYNNLTLSNFVGTPTQPIRFVNCGGQVQVESSTTTTVQVKGSRYIAISGTGAAAYDYGFKITNQNTGGSMGIAVGDLSSDTELDHIEVAKAGFAGIMVKTDPSCDSTTWRANFTMYNVKVHHNYVHDTGGEGLYIGNSFYGDGMTVTCNGVQKQVYPHLIYGLEINHNRIERTGAEGLQYGCAPDAKVHHNWMQYTGISPFAAYQNNGLQIGGGAGGDCYNNTVLNAVGSGIILVGHLGNNRVFNNVISQVGGDGIFSDERTGSVPNTFVQLINNTISGCGRDGIRLYNQININTITNNAITNYSTGIATWVYAGRPIVLEQGATATRAGNYTALSAQSAGYVDAAAGNFALLPTSPLIDAGVNTSAWGVVVDLLDQVRPQGNGYDIGAYEFVAQVGGSGRQAIARSTETELATATAYPTPCQDQVTIRVPSGQLIQRIDVYSLLGSPIRQVTAASNTNSHILSTQDWPSGIYLYQIQTQSGQFLGRLLKQ